MRFTVSRMGSTLLPCVLFLTVPVTRANILVLSNLNQSISGQDTDSYVGQAFVAGPAASSFYSATLLVNYTPVAPELEIEAMNADGTVGSTLYATTTDTYNSGQLTFISPTSFILAANTGYFLVLSDPRAAPSWEFSASSSYTALSGFFIPSADTTFLSSADNAVSGRRSGYETLANGPELFSLTTAVVAEPPTLFYLLPLAVVGTYVGRRRRPRDGALLSQPADRVADHNILPA